MAPPRAPAGDPRRSLPSVEALLQDEAVGPLLAAWGRALVVRHARAVLAEERMGAAAGRGPDAAALSSRLRARLSAAGAPSLRAVLNATGIVVHTNLGRAPLPPAAAARVAELAAGYTNLEMDLDSGERGRRDAHAERRLAAITRAEAALVVNNNAAAVLLAIDTLAHGREVVVSRGELVEIGGSFRVPDVLQKGGARLVEVGTTNRTRIADYRAALCPATALLLKVHPSNFRMVGFTEEATRAELVALAREHGVPVMEDMGSGLLEPLPPPLHREDTVAATLAAGVDLVTFSGDKLLGGPQAGLVAGRAPLVAVMRANPLYRALRVDKMTIAALDAVLGAHERGAASLEIPVHAMLALRAAELRPRAEALAAALGGCAALADGVSRVGGGAAPDVELETVLVTIAPPSGSAETLAHALRAGETPVVARVSGGRVLLDLRTVPPDRDASLAGAVLAALAVVGGPT